MMMWNGKKKRTAFIFFTALLLYLLLNPFLTVLEALPDHIVIYQGEEEDYSVQAPFGLTLTSSVDVLNVSDVTSLEEAVQRRDTVLGTHTLLLTPVKEGDTELNLTLFGLTLKQVDVTVSSRRQVYVGGDCVGLKLLTDGLLIVGISNVDQDSVKYSPGLEAGLKQGDVLLQANGEALDNAKDLMHAVEKSGGKSITLVVRRDGQESQYTIRPGLDTQENKFMLGLWVRDSTIGVGTLTFVDVKTGTFAALGHPVTDMDTGVQLPVNAGTLSQSYVIDVKVGQQGSPGELKGSVDANSVNWGNVEKNTSYGVYGTITDGLDLSNRKLYSVAERQEVHTGPATILATVEGNERKEYAVNIIKVVQQDQPAPKGLVVQVTDPELIARTGGIVQGMSGSPIIQDGKLVGAVTHVFVNDPLKGYGVFVDWMLQQLPKGN